MEIMLTVYESIIMRVRAYRDDKVLTFRRPNTL